MKIIACAAQLANGKDVACDYLATKLNSQWERASFADAVKDIYCQAFGVTREFIEKWKRNPEPPPGFLKNVRHGLQFIGDGFRQIKADAWLDIALRDETKNLIFSDSRYINEARKIKSKNGLMIVMYRPGFLNDDPNPSESQIRPVVEWLWDNATEGPIVHDRNQPETIKYYDYFLINDGTIEDLYEKIDTGLVPWVKSYFKE